MRTIWTSQGWLAVTGVFSLAACTWFVTKNAKSAPDAALAVADAGAPVCKAPESLDPRGSPPSPFHVFAVERSADLDQVSPGEERSHLHLCPVHGMTLFCGLPALFSEQNGNALRDPDLEAGLAAGQDGMLALTVEDVVGQFPDDAWLLGRYSTGARGHTIAHWQDGAWVPAAPGTATSESARLFSWGRGGALVIWGRGDIRFQGFGNRAGPMPTLKSPDDSFWTHGFSARGRVGVEPLGLTALSDGSIRAIEDDLSHRNLEVVRTWTSAQGWRVDRLAYSPDVGGPIVAADFFGESPDELTIFGENLGYPDEDKPSDVKEVADAPYLARLSNGKWSRMSAPGKERIRSYARNKQGTAWAVFSNKELWTRTANGQWSNVSLPIECVPQMVSVSDDGSPWVTCRQGGSWMNLLSTHQPADVVCVPNVAPH